MNLKDRWSSLDKNKKIMTYVGLAVLVILIITIIVVVVMPGKNKEDNNKPTPTQTPTQTKEPVAKSTKAATKEPKQTIPAGKAVSRLTGKYIDKKVAKKRPIAVMFNNISVASPQSGISQADILYECVTEGGITRLMGIFQNTDSDRIGSLRSARHYFVSFAKEWDAIYIHVGGSDAAYDKIKALEIDDLNGIYGIGNTLVYRDKSIKAPHNAFTSTDKIAKSVEQMGFRTKYKGKDGNHFNFNEKNTTAKKGKAAVGVSIKYSSYTSPYFNYDKKKGVYVRYQFGEKHTDYNTGKQLKFKNIILMNVNEWTMDSSGRQDMDITDNTGDGWYITNGKAVKIKWKKKESDNSMKFLDESGKLLSINKGKTYIGVVPDSLAADTVFSSKAK